MTATKQATTVRAFAVEADHPNNCDLFIQGIGCKMRSAIKHSKLVRGVHRHRQTDPKPAPANMTPGLPMNIPGQWLLVDPEKLTWELSDPLCKKPDLCAQISQAIREDESSPFRNHTKVEGVPTTSGKLTQHQMKTLCRELAGLLEAEHVRVVKGVEPEQEDIDAMPGEYLTVPFSTTRWNVPQFEKDVEEWQETLNRLK